MTGFASGALYLVPRCAKLLLEAGATVNLAARDSEVTPLHVAWRGMWLSTWSMAPM